MKTPRAIYTLIKKRKLGLVKRIQKQIDKFGITQEDLDLNLNHCKTAT